jgi:hypothetical protein
MKLRDIFAFRDPPEAETSKPFLEHLEDLRWMIVKMAGVLIFAMFFCFAFRQWLVSILQRPLNEVGSQVGALRALGITDMHADFSHWSLNGAVGPYSGAGVIEVDQFLEPDDMGNTPRSNLVFLGAFRDTTYSFPESPSLNVSVDWGFLTNDPYLFSNTSLSFRIRRCPCIHLTSARCRPTTSIRRTAAPLSAP